jgi:predicted site-specific integrase-resolvase
MSIDDEDKDKDMEDILEEFVPKKKGERKAPKKKEGETAEEELGESQTL